MANCSTNGEMGDKVGDDVTTEDSRQTKEENQFNKSVASALAKQEAQLKTVMDQQQKLTALVHTIVSALEREIPGIFHSCPDKFVKFEENCFRYYDEGKTWFEAFDACSSVGAHLAEPRTLAKQDFIFANFGQKRAWLGGYRSEGESSGGKWVWVTGGDVADGFRNWDDAVDLSRSDSGCMVMMTQNGGTWFLGQCTGRRAAHICERPASFSI